VFGAKQALFAQLFAPAVAAGANIDTDLEALAISRLGHPLAPRMRAWELPIAIASRPAAAVVANLIGMRGTGG